LLRVVLRLDIRRKLAILFDEVLTQNRFESFHDGLNIPIAGIIDSLLPNFSPSR
jgi:hypothetical protein